MLTCKIHVLSKQKTSRPPPSLQPALRPIPFAIALRILLLLQQFREQMADLQYDNNPMHPGKQGRKEGPIYMARLSKASSAREIFWHHNWEWAKVLHLFAYKPTDKCASSFVHLAECENEPCKWKGGQIGSNVSRRHAAASGSYSRQEREREFPVQKLNIRAVSCSQIYRAAGGGGGGIYDTLEKRHYARHSPRIWLVMIRYR
jgi:hypothetical protein